MPTEGPAKGLSIFFPAYNDSGTIASLVITALRTARTADAGLRGHRRQRRQRRQHRGDSRRARAHLSRGPRRPPRAEPRLRRRAAHRLRNGHARTGLLHRRRRAVRSGRDGSCSGARFDDDVDLVNGYKISRSDPLHRIVIGRDLPPHGQAAVRPDGPRRGLRLPADAAIDLRQGPAGEEQRRHLPRDDEEDHRRRLPHRRSAGASLPPRLRQVAVLQLPAPVPHRRSTSSSCGSRWSSGAST